MKQDIVDRLKLLALDQGFDALALMPGPNLFYATHLNFFVSERPIVFFIPVEAAPAVVLPKLEAGKARAAGFQTFTYTDEQGYNVAFHAACAHLELAGARVGVESLRMRLLEARTVQRYAPNVDLVPADDLFATLRMIKSTAELDAMRRAVAVAEQAFQAWLPQLRVGMTEQEAAGRLIAALLSHGAEGLSFSPIVCAGPNGALPHAVPGPRPFQLGDWMVVDWGAVIDGYASDITRTVVFGEPEGEICTIHDVVCQANAAGRTAAKPGVTAQAIDVAARTVIEDAGYGDYFIHRTGHGLGLEAHEPPAIVGGNELVLRPGMTFTVEPGIYIPDLGGVRIEDDVTITEDGAETLTQLPRAPFVVPGDTI